MIAQAKTELETIRIVPSCGLVSALSIPLALLTHSRYGVDGFCIWLAVGGLGSCAASALNLIVLPRDQRWPPSVKECERPPPRLRRRRLRSAKFRSTPRRPRSRSSTRTWRLARRSSWESHAIVGSSLSVQALEGVRAAIEIAGGGEHDAVRREHVDASVRQRLCCAFPLRWGVCRPAAELQVEGGPPYLLEYRTATCRLRSFRE